MTQRNRFTDQESEILRSGINSPGSCNGLEAQLQVEILPGALPNLSSCAGRPSRAFKAGEGLCEGGSGAAGHPQPEGG